MKIEDLISGKSDGEDIKLGDESISVSGLKGLLQDGYTHLKPYQQNLTFSLWGKTCTACLTSQQILERI
ncbi:hypothetical protein ACFL9T_11400 [Thermodesulfobacteriota bacterium]